MTDKWHEGFRHYQRGNYYAARDIWKSIMKSAEDANQRVRACNSLGAVYSILQGPEQALPYFTEVLAMVERINPEDPLRIKYLSNMSWVMTYLDNAKFAVHYGQEAVKLLNLEQAYESLFALNTYMMALCRFGLQDAILRHACEITDFIEKAAQREGVDKVDVARSFHFMGRAHYWAKDYHHASYYYQRAVSVHEMHTTVQELARVQLLQGRLEEALQQISKLYQTLWMEWITMQKVNLADTMLLIGMIAYFAGRSHLYRRCMEKSELYYGQSLRWNQWAFVRAVEETLSTIHVPCSADALDWTTWEHCLDDMSLLDGIEAMFPSLFRWSQVANHLTVRLAHHVTDDFSAVWPLIRIAGRMVYLGMTALASHESEAHALLADTRAQQDISCYGARILDAYPHAFAYRDLVRYYRDGTVQDLPPRMRTLAQCIGMATEFVECVELHQMTHQQAVECILATGRSRYDADVLAAFQQETGLGG
jgi:tetratricopeptide (TPR) repeat protein